uniref:C-type lectin domain-containing protein n=1 Tax=Parascaris univalens TaxID=6257 RepID=A0A915BXP7_PARUN
LENVHRMRPLLNDVNLTMEALRPSPVNGISLNECAVKCSYYENFCEAFEYDNYQCVMYATVKMGGRIFGRSYVKDYKEISENQLCGPQNLHEIIGNLEAAPCEAGWTPFAETKSCYSYVEIELYANEAVSHCKSKGSYLSSFTSLEEMNFLQEIANKGTTLIGWKSSGSQGQWIGGALVNRPDERIDTIAPQDTCIVFHSPFFFTQNCIMALYFICVKPASS